MSSSKHLTCKGTWRQVFIRVYRLEIQSVMLAFSTQFCELLPLSPSLWFNSPPHPCVNKYTTVCTDGGNVWGSWPQTDKTPAAKSLYRSILIYFLDDNILHCLLWVLSFYGHNVTPLLPISDSVDTCETRRKAMESSWKYPSASTEEVWTRGPQTDLTEKIRLTRWVISSISKTSVADPGCLSRIPDSDFYPSRIQDLGSRIQKQQQKRGVKKN